MRNRSIFTQFFNRAPASAGVVFLACIALATTGCDKKAGTPEWAAPGDESPAAVQKSDPERKPARANPQGDSATSESRNTSEGLRFISYNVENWLTMDRYVDRKLVKNLPKPESEKQAIVKLLANQSPDVIGLCEIGEAGDLAEIRDALKAAGLDLPFTHYVGGSDPVRHQGILSRFPITSTAKPAETEFKMSGSTFGINRGILDASIEAGGKPYRFIGVHLKSKREVKDVDQEDMRIHEARLLRRHVDSILQADANTRLVVYGDFNDTRPSKAFKTVTGSYNDPGYLTAIPAKDSRGEAWTHYWSLHDIYSRIDFITLSRAMRSEVDFRASHIIDDPAWNEASDHRPVLAIFK